MRLLLLAGLWIGLFAVLVRLLPPGYHLPLYCLFLLLGVGYLLWHWRRIGARRALLEAAYEEQRPAVGPGPGGGEEE